MADGSGSAERIITPEEIAAWLGIEVGQTLVCGGARAAPIRRTGPNGWLLVMACFLFAALFADGWLIRYMLRDPHQRLPEWLASGFLIPFISVPYLLLLSIYALLAAFERPREPALPEADEAIITADANGLTVERPAHTDGEQRFAWHQVRWIVPEHDTNRRITAWRVLLEPEQWVRFAADAPNAARLADTFQRVAEAQQHGGEVLDPEHLPNTILSRAEPAETVLEHGLSRASQ